MTSQPHNGFLIPISLMIAFLLTLLPMPGWTVWLRPEWILMVVIYWAMVAPERFSVGIAWMVGIFLDVLAGTLLGEHALALTIVTYLVVRSHTRLRMYPLLQQGCHILMLSLLYQFILFSIQGFVGELPNTWLYWVSSFISMLLWPWVLNIIRNYHYRFEAI
jgi:rod shape-determining protein MreD